MAANDEIVRLVLDLAKSAGSQSTIELLERARAAANLGAQAYEVLERQVGTYDVLERAAVQTRVTHVDATNDFYRSLIQAAPQVGLMKVQTEQMTAATHTLIGQNKAGGQGILGASYAVQDFTSQLGTQGLAGGLRAVQNNVPQILMGLGAGAGLTGIVSVLVVGVGLLVDNWDKLRDSWAGSDIAGQKKKMEDLAEATKKAADEGERLLKTQGQEQKQGTKELKRAIDAFSGKEVRDAVMKAMFGEKAAATEAHIKPAEILITNALSGNLAAQQHLRDLNVRGPIGQVLRGGKTPEEDQAAALAASEREAKQKDDAIEFQRKKKADLNAEVADAEEEARQTGIEMGEAMKRSEHKDADTRRKDDISIMDAADRKRQGKQAESAKKFAAIPFQSKAEMAARDEASRQRYRQRLAEQQAAGVRKPRVLPRKKELGPKGPAASINKPKPVETGPTPEQERSGNTVALLGQLTTNQVMIASNDSQRIEQMTISAAATGAQLTQNQNRSSRSTGFQT